MSESHLPDDPASWPSDPYRLLGVARGTEPRLIRKAYHALIRRFKPEHAPEAFRRIREAFEATQGGGGWSLAHHVAPIDPEPIVPAPAPEAEPWGGPIAPPPPVDYWTQACVGGVVEAYRGLKEGVERNPRAEERYCQLYWLLVVAPEVEPDLLPTAWLIRGLRACGTRAGRLRELLRREAEADPLTATEPRWTTLMDAGTPVDLVEFVAEWRWRSARLTKRAPVIILDVDGLRRWLPEESPAAFARLLLLAAENLAWGVGKIRDARQPYRAQAEQFAHDHMLDIDDELTRYEYADAVTNGLRQRGWAGVGEDGLADLLSHAWGHRGPDLRANLHAFAAKLSRIPEAALVRLDTVYRVAPAVLGLFWEILGGHQGGWPDAALAFATQGFLARSRWSDYPEFRVQLLDFCLRERVAPAIIARVIQNFPGYILPGNQPLGLVIGADWPLLAVYRTCEVARE